MNGESTGEKVGDIDEIVPVKMDGSITVHAESGEQKSYEVNLRYGSSVYLEFDLDARDLSEGDLEEYMYDYLLASVEANNERNIDLVEVYLYPEGSAYDDANKYIDDLEEEGITEKFVDVTVQDYEETEDGYLVTTHDEYIISSDDGAEKEITNESFKICAGLKTNSKSTPKNQPKKPKT